MIPFAGIRPSIPEYPQIADNIRQAIYEVQFENKDPNQVLADAAFKICKGIRMVEPDHLLYLGHVCAYVILSSIRLALKGVDMNRYTSYLY